MSSTATVATNSLSEVERSVFEALSNAFENGEPHEHHRSPEDVVREIHDWSGILGFDCEDSLQTLSLARVVTLWREENPDK
jgi:hypothetical protein